MDIDNLSEFTVLNLFGRRTINEFIDAQDTYINESQLFKLQMIYYLINTKGSCWTRDILDIINSRSGQEKAVKTALYFLAKNRYLKKMENDKVLGSRYELTNKSMFILRSYAAWLREQQRKYHYKIKESHKKSRELKEK